MGRHAWVPEAELRTAVDAYNALGWTKACARLGITKSHLQYRLEQAKRRGMVLVSARERIAAAPPKRSHKKRAGAWAAYSTKRRELAETQQLQALCAARPAVMRFIERATFDEILDRALPRKSVAA